MKFTIVEVFRTEYMPKGEQNFASPMLKAMNSDAVQFHPSVIGHILAFESRSRWQHANFGTVGNLHQGHSTAS
jgi:hypothetical protein